jgi:hypothetical protein
MRDYAGLAGIWRDVVGGIGGVGKIGRSEGVAFGFWKWGVFWGVAIGFWKSEGFGRWGLLGS